MVYRDRHARTERVCEWCGEKFMARVERVNAGQGRFCSLKHANLYQTNNDTKDAWGKEKGKKYWTDGRWAVHWRSGSGKVHVTSYPKWWWELNVGEVPKGYVVSYVDGNPENIDSSNFEVVSRSSVSAKSGKKSLGISRPYQAKERSKWWRGGSSHDGYPTEFSHSLKKRIKIRDNYTCQCCYSTMASPLLDVHHIDRNRKHNNSENLVTVCHSCHLGIHSRSSKTNPQIEYYKDILSQL